MSPRAFLARAGRALVGILAGGLMAIALWPAAVLSGLALAASAPWSGARAATLAAVERGLTAFVAADLARLRRWLDVEPGPPARSRRRRLGYLGVRMVSGPAGLALVVVGLAVGVGYTVAAVVLLGRVPATTVAATLGVGLVALYLTAQVSAGGAALDRRVAARLGVQDGEPALRRRVQELVAGRADVLAAVDDERRRIERDLHDGVQQRVVALAVLLGRALRVADPERASALTRQAHDDARGLAGELREVVWRVFPAVLDEAGLHAAVETLAERSPIPVAIGYDVPGEPAGNVAVAAYFVISEGVTNAVKHAGATAVRVEVVGGAGRLRIRVRDDGCGGADPHAPGGGLSGLARRVRGLDGHLEVDSPPGGPTVVTAELPCA